MAFDSTGRFYAVEFAEDVIDELNRVVKGRNYGWPLYEGGDGPDKPIADPFVVWSPTAGSSASSRRDARTTASRSGTACRSGTSACPTLVRRSGGRAGVLCARTSLRAARATCPRDRPLDTL